MDPESRASILRSESGLESKSLRFIDSTALPEIIKINKVPFIPTLTDIPLKHNTEHALKNERNKLTRAQENEPVFRQYHVQVTNLSIKPERCNRA